VQFSSYDMSLVFLGVGRFILLRIFFLSYMMVPFSSFSSIVRLVDYLCSTNF
jgi:hypothetical protein